MCVIIVKPAGIEVDKSLLSTIYTMNSDGWGLMFSNGNHVQVEKGFKKDAFLEWVEDLKDVETMIHCRIATSGELNIENCHPFKVTNGIYLMHNGIIGVPSVEKSKCDTWHFAKYVAKPIIDKNPNLFGSEMMIKLFEYIVGASNKLVFLRADGETMIINEAKGTVHEELWLSNDSCLFTGSAYTSRYGRYTDPYDLTEEWEHNYSGYVGSAIVSNNSGKKWCSSCQNWVDQGKLPWGVSQSGYLAACFLCTGKQKKSAALITAEKEKRRPKEIADLAGKSIEDLTKLIMEFPADFAWFINNGAFNR